MQSIFTILTIIVAIVVFSYFWQFLTIEWENLQQGIFSQAQGNASKKQSTGKQTFVKSAGTAAIVKPKGSAISVNTYITAGPEEGEIIEETNKVTFEFEAKISPEETKGRVSFETKIEGFDDDWKKTYSKKRTISLPPGPKEYIFLVRAKIKDSVDPTPAKRTFKMNVSPYFEKVRISSVRIQKSENLPSYRSSLITLRTYLKEEEINITGWHIKGRGGSFVIPAGIEKYLPGYNSIPQKSIFVKQGDKIYMSGGSNPLGRGRNFRPNKCMGYLANSRDFIISLSKKCPKPKREEISHLRPCCQGFILRLGRCKVPDYSSDWRISRDSQCVSYLNKNFNYEGCFINYSRDENFLEKKWHIYLGSDITTSGYCDTLYLRDQNGLIVDTYSYGRPVCK
ncbi:hypothetical protein KJA15_02225 [Patescibacteria group bacterium]|nr:hypothetical protein [Patescibacteria group bacterium]